MCFFCENEGSQMQPVLLKPLDMGISGQLLMDVAFDAGSGKAQVNVVSPSTGESISTGIPIDFCPFCGRKITSSDRKGCNATRLPQSVPRRLKNMEGSCLTKIYTGM